MNSHSRLIVLSYTKTGEKSVVLHTLSPDWGRRSFVVGVGRTGSLAMYLPLNILDAEVVVNPKSDLWRLRGVSVVSPLFGIRSSVGKNAIAMFMSEVLYRCIREGMSEDGLFDWCERSIMTLDALETAYYNFHLRFLLELCVVMGFAPSLSDLAPFAGGQYSSLRSLLDSGFEETMLLRFSGEQRNEMASILLRYLGYHIESRIEARSLPVLRELFS